MFGRLDLAGRVMDVPFTSISGRLRRKRTAARARSVLWAILVACTAAIAVRLRNRPPTSSPLDLRQYPRTGEDPGEPKAARTVPDALKFANGLLRQRKYDLAAEEYERFAKSGAHGRDLDDAQFGLASARLYQGNFAESRRAFDEFLKGRQDDPRKLTARYRLGELAYLVGDLAAARRSLEEFSAATTDHSGLEMALTYLGDTCFGLQDYTPALAAYQRSLAAYPKGRLADRAKYGLGRTLAALGQRDKAVSIMQELAKSSKPEWVDRAWLQIGLIRKADGRLAEAAEAFATLERVTPRSSLWPEAQLQRALVLLRLERDAEAEPLLRALASNAPAASARGRLWNWRRSSSSASSRRRPGARCSRHSSGFRIRRCCRRCIFESPKFSSSNTVSRKPRRNSNRWPKPIPTIPGPTTRSSEPRRPRSIARMSRERGAWPARSRRDFPRARSGSRSG